MTEGAYKTAVKPDISGFGDGHGYEFGAAEVVLDNAVFFKQQVKKVKLNLFAGFIVFEGARADNNVKLFTLNALRQGAFVLLLRKVRKKVGDGKAGFVLFFADDDFFALTVFKTDNAVKRQGGYRPVVFSYTAVVVGFKITDFVGLVKGVALKVKAGVVDMRRNNIYALGCRLFADYQKRGGFAAVVNVKLIARVVFFAHRKLFKSLFFGERYGVFNRFALGFGYIEKLFITLAIAVRRLYFGVGHFVVGALVFRGKFFFNFFCCHTFHLSLNEIIF